MCPSVLLLPTDPVQAAGEVAALGLTTIVRIRELSRTPCATSGCLGQASELTVPVLVDPSNDAGAQRAHTWYFCPVCHGTTSSVQVHPPD